VDYLPARGELPGAVVVAHRVAHCGEHHTGFEALIREFVLHFPINIDMLNCNV
jgi:hypothetical protein